MRSTKKVSVWPVGLVGNVRFERPILDEHGKVANWSTGWRPERPFAIDMAGFAINLKYGSNFVFGVQEVWKWSHFVRLDRLLLDNPDAEFSFDAPRGYQESTILAAVVTKADLEPKAEKCTKVTTLHSLTIVCSISSLLLICLQVYVWHTRTENPKLNDLKGKIPSVNVDLTVEVWITPDLLVDFLPIFPLWGIAFFWK